MRKREPLKSPVREIRTPGSVRGPLGNRRSYRDDRARKQVANGKTPRCFISYAWEGEKHLEWVRILAERLQLSGVFVILDQWDVAAGAELPAFMESAVREADFVLLICTPTFAEKANSGKGGVGYEKSIVTGEIFARIATAGKFVPLLRAGEPAHGVPSYLLGRKYIDFRNDDDFESVFEDLLRHLYSEPRFVRPPLGPKPNLKATPAAMTASPSRTASQPLVYCRRCGAGIGRQSICTGAYSHHDFHPGTNADLCRRCGGRPGQQSICTGAFTAHDFAPGSAAVYIYCRRCGAVPGQPSVCTGAYTAHDFGL